VTGTARSSSTWHGALLLKKLRENRISHYDDRKHVITLQQDADGFIRMTRHFPDSATIAVSFTDGSSEGFTGQRLNEIYDRAVSEYRTLNNLDAKGFSRRPTKTVQPANTIEFVAIQPGMAD
jgi:hypothetical protein